MFVSQPDYLPRRRGERQRSGGRALGRELARGEDRMFDDLLLEALLLGGMGWGGGER